MDHAEVLERLADAAAGAHGAERLWLDDSLDAALREHLDDCPACRAEVAAWRMTAQALVASAPESLRVPDAARERILWAVVSTGVPRGDAPTRPARASGPTPIRFRRLALAAAAVLVIFVAGALLGGPLGLIPRDKSAVALAAAVAASDQILQQPLHREAVLLRSDGTSAGSVLVNPANGQIVVLSSPPEPADPEEYHCYFVRDGQPALWIGPMQTDEGTSFWAGWVHDVADVGRPGDVIQVVDGGEAPELTATF